MRKYRITFYYIGFLDHFPVYCVQVKKWYGWSTIKEFHDFDKEFARMEAEELIDKLME